MKQTLQQSELHLLTNHNKYITQKVKKHIIFYVYRIFMYICSL